MKKIILFSIIIITLLSCTPTKKITINDYNSTIKIDSINIREIALKDAYEAFPNDTLLVRLGE